MNGAEALAFITARLAPDADPTMTTAEVTALLPVAQGIDADGLPPSDASWTPTYTVRGCYAAITEGWLLKYGKAVGRFPFVTDGQTFQRDKTHDQIEHQRRYYARKVQTSPSTLGAIA